MFGYVRIRKAEMKVKDYETYHGFYCGLCHTLKQQYGFLGQMTLTYDMTFLVILLSSVYDSAIQEDKRHCIVHPAKKHRMITNEMTEYAAGLNMILTYYHFQDDKEDEKSKKAWAGMQCYKRKMKKASKLYQRQDQAVQRELTRLHELEKAKETDIMKVADCFGRLMEELFVCREGYLEEYLKTLGYHLGRFIYIMDAYDDLEKDRQKGCYNPLLASSKQRDFEQKTQQLLLHEMEEAAAAYQLLPCLEYKDILGNILYAGVWNRYDDIQTEKRKQMKLQEEQ